MSSIITVLVPPSSSDLTTLAVLKEEFSVKNSANDSKFRRWITEVSATVETYLDRSLSLATVQESFTWATRHSTKYGLILNQFPIVSVTSLTLDSTVLDPASYSIDANKGILYRLDVAGFRRFWGALNISVVYVAGFAAVEDVPADISRACLIMLRHRYALGNRDPTIKSEAVAGVLTSTYWVGGIGENAAVPPEAAALLDPYREMRV